MTSLDIAKKLNAAILADARIKAFKEIEAQKSVYDELIVLENELKQLQKEIVRLKTIDCDEVFNVIDVYNEKKMFFDCHPIVLNYMYCLEDADCLLQFVNNEINNRIIHNDTLD